MTTNDINTDTLEIMDDKEIEYNGCPISTYDLLNWVVIILKQTDNSNFITCKVIDVLHLKNKTILYTGENVETKEKVLFKVSDIKQIVVDNSSKPTDIIDDSEEDTGESVSDVIIVENETEIVEETLPGIGGEVFDLNFPEPYISDFFKSSSLETENPFMKEDVEDFRHDDIDSEEKYSNTMLMQNLITKVSDVLDNVEKRVTTKIRKEGLEIFQRHGVITESDPSQVAVATLESTISFIKMEYNKSGIISEKSIQNLITFGLEYLLTLEANNYK